MQRKGQRTRRFPAATTLQAEIGPIVMENPATRVSEIAAAVAQPSRPPDIMAAALPPHRTVQFRPARLKRPAIDIQRIAGRDLSDVLEGNAAIAAQIQHRWLKHEGIC
jgi:hypothetical protein